MKSQHPAVGVVLVLQCGSDILIESDFDMSCPGGFKLEEVQLNRAKQRLAVKLFQTHCSEIIYSNMDEHLMNSFLNKLITSKKCHLTIQYISVEV